MVSRKGATRDSADALLSLRPAIAGRGKTHVRTVTFCSGPCRQGTIAFTRNSHVDRVFDRPIGQIIKAVGHNGAIWQNSMYVLLLAGGGVVLATLLLMRRPGG